MTVAIFIRIILGIALVLCLSLSIVLFWAATNSLADLFTKKRTNWWRRR